MQLIAGTGCECPFQLVAGTSVGWTFAVGCREWLWSPLQLVAGTGRESHLSIGLRDQLWVVVCGLLRGAVVGLPCS